MKVKHDTCKREIKQALESNEGSFTSRQKLRDIVKEVQI